MNLLTSGRQAADGNEILYKDLSYKIVGLE